MQIAPNADANESISEKELVVQRYRVRLQCERLEFRAQRSGRTFVSNARGSGFEPRQEQEFLLLYETLKLLGAGTLSHVKR
jgi:hypothetical protein